MFQVIVSEVLTWYVYFALPEVSYETVQTEILKRYLWFSSYAPCPLLDGTLASVLCSICICGSNAIYRVSRVYHSCPHWLLCYCAMQLTHFILCQQQLRGAVLPNFSS